MLEVETNHQIILLYFREGLSQRKIALKLKIHRDTVKDHITQYEKFKAASASDKDDPKSLLSQYLKVGPAYNSKNRIKRKLTGDILDIIDACLQENEIKRNTGRIKQQLKKIDIHEKIVSAGHSISYPAICAHISTRLGQQKEAFIRQGYSPGFLCEFDWGEVKIRVGGKLRRYYLAVFTSAFSNYRYAVLFQRQDSLAFKEAHICFFEHIGGVYHEMLYDNMRVAVAQFVGKTEKVPTEGLKQLARWYQFGWRFCNIARGNEKGHVERSVEYIRRKVFAFKDDFDTLQQAQDYLLLRTTELNLRPGTGLADSPALKMEMERKGLYSNPERMECFMGDNFKVDKYSTICFGTNRYSIPDHLIGRTVFVKIYSERIRIYYADKVLCQHMRAYDRNCWQLDLNHYLNTLGRKPGALAHCVALKQAPAWMQAMYTEYFMTEGRDFVELLQYCKKYEISNDHLKSTVDKVIALCPINVTAGNVMALLGNQEVEMAMTSHEPDPIAVRSLENLKELAFLMLN